jgi:thioredoxin-dependent peroxiredoxin
VPDITEGAPAPDFSLPTDTGTVSLAALKGRKVVLYFYPKDDTPGCTNEAQQFSQAAEEFAAADTVVVGVSRDSVKRHANFRKKYALTVELGADDDGKVTEAYGVWVEKSLYGRQYMGIERATFLIDRQGVVRKVWRKVKVPGHVQDALQATQAID